MAAAFATSRFVISIIKGLLGKNVIECAYVKSVVHPHSKYLATPLQLGPGSYKIVCMMLANKNFFLGGVQRNLGIPDITEYEKCLLETAILDIQKDVAMAEKFLDVKDPDKCNVCNPNIKSPPCPRDHCKPRTLYD